MEDRVLQVVVVERDEDGEGDKRKSEIEAEEARARIGEGSVTHDTGSVNHGEFVDELHRVCEKIVSNVTFGRRKTGENMFLNMICVIGPTFQRCMKEKASSPN